MGLAVHRVSPDRPRAGLPEAPLYEDPMEAVYALRAGSPAAFRCAVDQCVFRNGFALSEAAWNPLRAAAEEIGAGIRGYEGSVLEGYYESWQPANALQALLLQGSGGPERLRALPAYVLHSPWTTRTLLEQKAFMEHHYNRELAESGDQSAHIGQGFFLHGPVSRRVGRIEHRRLYAAFESIRKHGYLRNRGDIHVMVLRRGRDCRFLICRGHHRTAAAAAAGIGHVPARVLNGAVIEAGDVDYWPQVRAGVWARREALNYFDHLFDFDSLAWSRRVMMAGTWADDPQPERHGRGSAGKTPADRQSGATRERAP